MPFTLTQISNHGSQHPVVARLQLQTADILQHAILSSNEDRDRAKTIYFNGAWRLLRCFDRRDELSQKIAEANPPQQTDDSQVVRAPHVINLEGIVEPFLYEAKNFLRDIAGVFEPLAGKCFDQASDLCTDHHDGAIEWSNRAFGNCDRLTTILRGNQPTIRAVVGMRNAIEHPDGRSGRLDIFNFEIVDQRLQPPQWRLNDGPLSPIVDDMRVACDALLTFAEEVLAALAEKKFHPMFQVVEIPVEQRNPMAPMRLKVDGTAEFYERLQAHFAAKQ